MNRTLFQRLLQPQVIVVSAIVVAVLAIGITILMTSGKPIGAYVTPTSGTIVQEVDTTGTVAAANAIDLSFQTNGQVAYAGPAVGTHVGAGTTLASLSGADLNAQLEQAKAGLAAQQAQLASLQAGATPQSIALSQTAVTNAQNTLAQAKQNIIQAARDASVKSDVAIFNSVDQMFSNPHGTSPTLTISSNNSQLVVSAQSGRVAMEGVLTAWQSYMAALPSDAGSIDVPSLESETSNNLAQVGTYLDQIIALLASASPSNSASSATLQSYQASVAAARGNISAAVSALNTAETAEQAAISGLATAQAQLTVTQAPPTGNAVNAQ